MRSLIAAGAILILCSLVCSCDESGPPIGYLGIWGQVDVDIETGIRLYERADELAGYSAGYSIEPGGYLIVRTMAYVGMDFPSPVEYLGTWEREQEDVLVFRYENYRGQYTIRFEIMQVGYQELTALVSSTGPV